MSKKILSVLMVVSLILTMGTMVFATDVTTSGGTGAAPVTLTTAGGSGTMFSVTVPMSLPITVNADGDVITATDVQIINNSLGPVSVTAVSVTGANGWTVVDYSSNMAYEKANTQKVGFKINNDTTGANGSLSFTESNFPVMNGRGVTDDSNKMDITYDAVVPAQTSSLTDVSVINVVFTVDWAS